MKKSEIVRKILKFSLIATTLLASVESGAIQSFKSHQKKEASVEFETLKEKMTQVPKNLVSKALAYLSEFPPESLDKFFSTFGEVYYLAPMNKFGKIFWHVPPDEVEAFRFVMLNTGPETFYRLAKEAHGLTPLPRVEDSKD